MVYFLVLVSVSISALSQILLRYGMTRPDIAKHFGTSTASLVLAIAQSPYVIGGFALYGLGALIWLSVLSKLPVSFAYPFVSLGIVLTTLSGVVILGETISLWSALGIALILAGILMMAAGRA